MIQQLVLCFALFAAPTAGGGAAPAADAAKAGIDHGLFDALLKKFVRGDRVDYAGFQKSAELGKYLEQIAATDPAKLPDRKARLAFWINAYNALTISGVLKHWPGIKSVQNPYPDFGFFKRKDYVVGGKKVSLNEIENEIIRPRFEDPRIHAALNCASVSCPPLAPFAFVPDRLDEQLDERMRAFARDRTRNAIDPKAGTVKLSQIFNWYADDFKAAGGVAAYLRTYLDEADAAAVKKAEAAGKLEFLEYDWGLNAAR